MKILMFFIPLNLIAGENQILRKKVNNGYCFYAQDGENYLSLNSLSLEKEDLTYPDLIWKIPLILSGGIFTYGLYLKWKNHSAKDLEEAKADIHVEQAKTLNEFIKQSKNFSIDNKIQINSPESYHYDIKLDQSRFFETFYVYIKSSGKTLTRKSPPIWEFMAMVALSLSGILKILQIQRDKMVEVIFIHPEIKDLKITYPYGKVLSHIRSHGEKCDRQTDAI
jgi:hypothetical protein